MSRRALLMLSAAASAFILVFIGAVASYGLRQPRAPTPTVASAAPPSQQSVPMDVVLAREAEYRRLIDEASSRLRAAQAAPAQLPATAPPRAREHHEDDDDDARTARHARHHHEDDDG